VSEVERSLERSHPVADVAQIVEITLDCCLHIEPAALVDRFHRGATAALRHPSDQQIGGRLDDCGKPLGRSGFDSNMSRLCEGGQSRGQTLVPEDHRVEAAGQLPQFGDRLLELAVGRFQLRGIRGYPRPEQAKRQRQADQPLLGAVVQVALQPAALFVALGHDADA
jgi:hypothetical protein